ncbi:MAG TPA: DUF418 domain-containing protein [Sphingomicrobium sp.]|nr:DUF418 domain-containing protein [Sphingomicrobium sp.]
MAELAAAPTARRIESLDFVRGVALFGILLMNIVAMGLGPAYDDPTVAGGDTGINLWTWFVLNVGIEGTQRALFSILFGAGVILLSSRLEATGRPDSADVFFRRNLLLVGFGLFNAWILLWEGDILFYYGVTALFLYAFRKLPGRTLLALGVGSLLLGAAWNALDASNSRGAFQQFQAASQVTAAERTAEQKKAIESWVEKEREFRPAPEAYAEIREANSASYWSALQSRAGLIAHFQSWWLYRYFFDIFGMMMIGMALFRLGVLTLEVKTHTYAAMMAGGYAIGLTGNIAEARWIMSNDFSMLAYHQAAISYDVSRLAMTMGHLGLLMLFLRSGVLPRLRQAMAAVGRMALTNYLAHSVVALVLFVFLGLWGALERHQLYYIVFAVWAVQIVVSPIWLRHFQFGPAEWLWRYLTYGKKPPFRRETPPEAPPVGPAAFPAE